jgi:NhaP-type Na+/H+ and K+/H+ antiporter
VALAANTVIAMAALAAGANSAFSPLLVFVYGPFTVVGLLAAYAGWRIVRRRASSPRGVLRVLVPVLAVLSFVPDTVLAITGFIPGTTLTGVVALMLMHLVVVAIAVPLSARLAPVR